MEDHIFDKLKQEEIAAGREQGLAVSHYENDAYSWLQMKEIRKGLADGVDTTLYESPEIPYEKMRELRRGLLAGMNLKPYLMLDAGLLRELRRAKEAGVDIIPYMKQGYQPEQLAQITGALEKRLDIAPYLTKRFLGVALKEIFKGLERGIDVSLYADPKYNWQQMREIRLGLERHLDVSVYANRFFDAKQMREIRTGLEEGVDVSGYAKFMYTASDMKRIRAKEERIVTGSGAIAAARELLTQEELLAEQLIAVSVSGDAMEAYVIAQGDMTELKREDVLQVLKRKGVVAGIDEEAISCLLRGETEEGKPLLIAKGRAPVCGKDGWYEYFFRIEVAKTPKQLEDGSVDYQSVEWFEIVTENQKVAEYHRAQNGTAGFTVTGVFLPAQRGQEQKMLRGSGYRLDADGRIYTAAMDGRIELRGNLLIITRMFIFDEITMATGNVDVDGNAYVKGNVGGGTIIKATGDVVIDGFIEGAVIESGGNIFLRKGVNASGQGKISAAGDIAGKFFEATSVHAGGDICANYSLDSELYAKGRVRLSGERGSIIGGRADGAQGIVVFNAGNAAGVPTHLHFGVTDEMRRRAQILENEIAEINQELEVFRNAYADFYQKYSAEERNTMELYLKIENAIYTKEKELAEVQPEWTSLEEIIKKAGDASAIVRGTAYEGVQFEANGVAWCAKNVQNIRVRRVNNRMAVYTN